MSELIDAARDARFRAYAPYSGFLVGAAIRTRCGAIHVGCNVENAAYPLGQCAEANAIAVMISAGRRLIEEMAVVGNGRVPCPPCGGCRQRLREFAGPDTSVHMLGADGGCLTMTLAQLLPASFGPDFLKDRAPLGDDE